MAQNQSSAEDEGEACVHSCTKGKRVYTAVHNSRQDLPHRQERRLQMRFDGRTSRYVRLVS